LTVSVYEDGFRHDLLLDSSYVVNKDNKPIYCSEADIKCLWPSFIIKAVAKVFGSYASLKNASLEDLLKVIYGPSLIQGRLGKEGEQGIKSSITKLVNPKFVDPKFVDEEVLKAKLFDRVNSKVVERENAKLEERAKLANAKHRVIVLYQPKDQDNVSYWIVSEVHEEYAYAVLKDVDTGRQVNITWKDWEAEGFKYFTIYNQNK
jgi:hypothetical protein